MSLIFFSLLDACHARFLFRLQGTSTTTSNSGGAVLDISDGLYYAVLLPLLLPTVAIYRFFVWVPVKFYQYN